MNSTAIFYPKFSGPAAFIESVLTNYKNLNLKYIYFKSAKLKKIRISKLYYLELIKIESVFPV